MKALCKTAKVEYFRYHPLRHSGASGVDNNGVPIASIQKILVMRVEELRKLRQRSHPDSHPAKGDLCKTPTFAQSLCQTKILILKILMYSCG